MSTEILEHESLQLSAGAAGPGTQTSVDSRQFVTFMVGNEVFAVDMAPVQEIIRLPEVVRVPLAPAALYGLANLRGKVLPIIAMRRLFGFAEREHDDASRAVVVDVGQPLGFVVDRVASVIAVEPRQIEDVGAISSTVNTDLLAGLIKDVGGHAIIMVLDFAKLIHNEFAQIAAGAQRHITAAGGLGAVSGEASDEEDAIADELQLVSFEVAAQEYAIAIGDVQEIVQVPESFIQVPRAQTHVLGVMTLRSRLLPLVSLRRLFQLPERPLDDKSRIVVLALDGASVGVAVDAVSEVLRVPRAQVDTMPALLARDERLADIAEICRLEDGARLVSIVTARKLFDHSLVQEALGRVNEIANDEEQLAMRDQDDEELDDDEQLVVFRLDKEEFGVPIASVQEIVRLSEQLIRVPKAPAFVEGVINLRGSVLPVIDLRLLLGLGEAADARSDRQRIMVFLLGEVRTGFIVDQVTEVLKIPQSAIEVAPKLSGEQSRLLSRMANLEKQKRMVQLLEPGQLLDSQDLHDLTTTLAP